MTKVVVWSALGWPGCEHLALRVDGGEVAADGLVLAVLEERPIRLRYRLSCDPDWRTNRLELDLFGAPTVVLSADQEGRWYDDRGEVADLAGCVDVDVSLTPFTNTLPIRRLGLQPEESADLRVLYVVVDPSLELRAAEQRYTRLDGERYRYRSGSFSAELRVDADGLVLDYPGLWRRVH